MELIARELLILARWQLQNGVSFLKAEGNVKEWPQTFYSPHLPVSILIK